MRFLEWGAKGRETLSDPGLRRPSRAVEVILAALLVFAPLAFGAVEFWSIAVVQGLILTLAGVRLANGLRDGSIYGDVNPLLGAGFGFLAWVGVQLLAGLTADAPSTRDAALLLLLDWVLLAVLSNEPWCDRRAARVGRLMAGIGFSVALFGLVQYLSWNGRLYWVRPIGDGTPFGPYVNHNHFAGLMEMIFPVALGLALRPGADRASQALWALFAAVMGLAVLVSLSRGGMAGLAAGSALLLALLARTRGAGWMLQITMLVAVLVAAGLLLLGVAPVLQRLATLGAPGREASIHSRLLVARDTLRIIRDHPLAGTGLGTFSLVFPRYLSFYSRWTWDKAHNDYLQLVAETGLVGLGFAVWWLASFFILFRRNLRADPSPELRLGAFCGCVAMLVHSLVDFNLQIPANALYFIVLAVLSTRPPQSASGRAAFTGDSPVAAGGVGRNSTLGEDFRSGGSISTD